MESKIVWEIAPTPQNGRNSEGAFFRAPDGALLFAYSRYATPDYVDDARCDIAMIRSEDEGETWGEPRIIVEAAFFGVQNVMSVSAVPMPDGTPCIYFLIKETTTDGIVQSTLGRAYSKDGVHFTPERCRFENVLPQYYVVLNDRMIRLSDGRILAPTNQAYIEKGQPYDGGSPVLALISDDDGASFHPTCARAALYSRNNTGLNQPWGDPNMCGLQEPGAIELGKGITYWWARTSLGCQYEWYSLNDLYSFTQPQASGFTSPLSPLGMWRLSDGSVVAVYNPIPNYDGRPASRVTLGRTPIILRRSTDNGTTFGAANMLDDDPTRGYCYPALFETADDHLLVSYCCGGEEDKLTLNRLCIRKLDTTTIE